MKKLSLLLAGILLIGAFLAGCDARTTDTKESGREVRLAVWGSSPAEVQALDKTIADFEGETGIKVVKEVISDSYLDVIKTRLIGGEGPDVFYLDSYAAAEVIESGAVMALDEWITDDFKIDDFYPSLLNAFRGSDRKLYGIPKDYSTLALYYNENLLKQAGYTPEDIPDSLEELHRFAEALQPKLPEGTKALTVVTDLARMMYLAESTGVDIIKDDKANIADPEIIKNLQLMVDARAKGYADNPQGLGTGWNGEAFGVQKTAMMIEGNWVISFLKEQFPEVKYGVKEVPAYNGKKGTMAYTVAYVINADTDNKENAWAFIQYMTGPRGMDTWTKGSGVLPSRKSVAQSQNLEEDPVKSAHVAGAQYATPWQKGIHLPTVMTNFNNEFLSAFLGKKSLKEAMEKAQEVANKEIAAQK